MENTLCIFTYILNPKKLDRPCFSTTPGTWFEVPNKPWPVLVHCVTFSGSSMQPNEASNLKPCHQKRKFLETQPAFPFPPPQKKKVLFWGGSKAWKSHPYASCLFSSMRLLHSGGRLTSLGVSGSIQTLSSLLAPWGLQQTNWNYSGHTVSTAEGTSFNCRNVFFWSFNTDFG